MARRIPPLNPLRVFEVVARTQNLTTAAQELHVTQSAVSRQITVLESYLEKKLFRRGRRGMTLTRQGAMYAEQIIPAFEEIARASESLDKSDSSVRVRTPTTFAAKWLIPHLPDFQRQHPKIQVHVINALPDVDFEYDRDPVDISVVQGDGRWPKAHAEFVFEDRIEPVCSPDYLARYGADPDRPETLLGHRLLVSRNRRRDWDDWLAATGLAHWAADTERMTFSISVLTWQAAIEGLGIAIGQLPHLGRDFASGALLRPFGRPVARRTAHYVVSAPANRQTRAARVFHEWMVDVIAAELSAAAPGAVAVTPAADAARSVLPAVSPAAAG
ncbi:transcriptional regulator GcvA [Pigmentiphaga soli]|uniref:Transcriptional regulator GcvA n=1 Tax=Pigmentiphaga soli TaxID=1007095 RepID=A0ABP8HS61_9BURK